MVEKTHRTGNHTHNLLEVLAEQRIVDLEGGRGFDFGHNYWR